MTDDTVLRNARGVHCRADLDRGTTLLDARNGELVLTTRWLRFVPTPDVDHRAAPDPEPATLSIPLAAITGVSGAGSALSISYVADGSVVRASFSAESSDLQDWIAAIYQAQQDTPATEPVPTVAGDGARASGRRRLTGLVSAVGLVAILLGVGAFLLTTRQDDQTSTEAGGPDTTGSGGSSEPEGGDTTGDIEVGALDRRFAAEIDQASFDSEGFPPLEDCPLGSMTDVAAEVDAVAYLDPDTSSATPVMFARDVPGLAPALDCSLTDPAPRRNDVHWELAVGANELLDDYPEYLKEAFGVSADTSRHRNGTLYTYCGGEEGAPDGRFCAAEWVADGSEVVLYLVLTGAARPDVTKDALDAVLPTLVEGLNRD